MQDSNRRSSTDGALLCLLLTGCYAQHVPSEIIAEETPDASAAVDIGAEDDTGMSEPTRPCSGRAVFTGFTVLGDTDALVERGVERARPFLDSRRVMEELSSTDLLIVIGSGGVGGFAPEIADWVRRGGGLVVLSAGRDYEDSWYDAFGYSADEDATLVWDDLAIVTDHPAAPTVSPFPITARRPLLVDVPHTPLVRDSAGLVAAAAIEMGEGRVVLHADSYVIGLVSTELGSRMWDLYISASRWVSHGCAEPAAFDP